MAIALGAIRPALFRDASGIPECASSRLGRSPGSAPARTLATRRCLRLQTGPRGGWSTLISAVAWSSSESPDQGSSLDFPGASSWCSRLPKKGKPTKGAQDCLDAVVCAPVGFIWRTCARNVSAVIGDTVNGYMMTPVSTATHKTLKRAAQEKGVPFA